MAKLNRIIIHWTAGQYMPNDNDRKHYHYMIDNFGRIHNGKFRPEDNISCIDGRYAEHTGGGNTGSIGIAICGMLGYQSPEKQGAYPLKLQQCEAAWKYIAGVCKRYNIPVTPQTVMTHMEFGKAHPASTSAGKIDICYLPPYRNVKDVGDFIRQKISWYLEKAKEKQ